MPRQRGGAARTTAAGMGRTRSTSVEASKGEEPNHGDAGSKPLGAGLYLVATPIGHAQDITLRALDCLRQADAVACEDTRVTAKLLARHGIRVPLLSYREHNAERMGPLLLARMRAGAAIALVSDAGTPLVSDPGDRLVRAALAEGLAVTALPGPSAALAALLVSGLPSDRFLFAGFLPSKATARRLALGELAAVPATLIFFEGPSRVGDSLADMAAVLGNRPAAVARELTKLHEEVRRGTLAALAPQYAAEGPPRGEVAIVVGPAVAPEPPRDDATVARLLTDALGSMSLREATKAVAEATALPRRVVYARALELLGEKT